MKQRLKRLLTAISDDAKQAVQLIKEDKDLATAVWKGSQKWIPGSTALHWAAHQGNLKIIKRLIKYGADINADEADWWCRPIDWAADNGQYEVVAFLLKKGADFGGDRWSNCTPLHVVAQGGSTNGQKRSADYKKTAEALIEHGADVNAIAQYGGQPPRMTPLDDALMVDNKVVAEFLQQYGGKKSANFLDI